MTITTLTGTEKQIAWAEEIRQPVMAFLATVEAKINTPGSMKPGTEALQAKVVAAMQRIAGETSAAKWIEFQDYKAAPSQLLNNIVSGRITF